jgi:Flp pilus assembly protein TadD
MARDGRTPTLLVRRAEILDRAGDARGARAAYEQARAVVAAHATTRRIHAFDALAERIAAALAAPPRGDDTCGIQSDAAWRP